MKWAEITVATTQAGAEAVASVMIEEGCGGAAIASPSMSLEAETRVSGYLPVDDLLELRLRRQKERISSLAGCLGEDAGSLEISVRSVEETNWAEACKAYYKPLLIGRVVIKPSWEQFRHDDSQVVVELDPGMAFGTGQHPTTQLCLLALQECVTNPMVVGDIGTGSGILAIAAAKLGASRVYAVDIDPAAVDIAAQNARRNGLVNTISVSQGDSPSALPEPVNLIVANIVPDTIKAIAPEAAERLLPGGTMISSGVVVDREADVLTSLEQSGLETIKVQRDGSWVAIQSRRPEAD